jgi:hypothetical protein
MTAKGRLIYWTSVGIFTLVAGLVLFWKFVITLSTFVPLTPSSVNAGRMQVNWHEAEWRWLIFSVLLFALVLCSLFRVLRYWRWMKEEGRRGFPIR